MCHGFCRFFLLADEESLKWNDGRREEFRVRFETVRAEGGATFLTRRGGCLTMVID